MITYDFTKRGNRSLYEYLCQCIKEDILSGKLAPGEKMPSKRALSANLGVSIITIESAYGQLLGEGYITSVPKKGYFVANTADMMALRNVEHVKVIKKSEETADSVSTDCQKNEPDAFIDFASNHIDEENFPFTIWAKLSRETLAENRADLMHKCPTGGMLELREAIADHLRDFRGMEVSPDQIYVGAGTEYLYGLLIQLLGRDRIYGIENPGYKKIYDIYTSHGVRCEYADMDMHGITVSQLVEKNADIAHVSPTHHYPTGITMPISRRYELLAWASKDEKRYIIEDDYDSEFRLNGRPIPSLYSIDVSDKVIYINTFSKSLVSTMRIAYMVLPKALAHKYEKTMSFYSCTVSTFEQVTLAKFINEGYFEKHINRTRLFYARQREKLMEMINDSPLSGHYQIIEEDSGLHFLIRLDTQKDDHELSDILSKEGIRLIPLQDFYHENGDVAKHVFIVNYASIKMDRLNEALKIISERLL